MAPEQVNSLAILDLRDPSVAGGCSVYRWIPESASQELIVLWESSAAEECPSGFIEATERVVCIAQPPGYKEYRYKLDPSADPLEQSWHGQVNGDHLMVIAILPSLYAFEALPGKDSPVKAKLVGDRMAVYWRYDGAGKTVAPAWKMSPVEDQAALRSRCAAIADGTVLPSPSELDQWKKARKAPIEGEPP